MAVNTLQPFSQLLFFSPMVAAACTQMLCAAQASGSALTPTPSPHIHNIILYIGQLMTHQRQVTSVLAMILGAASIPAVKLIIFFSFSKDYYI
jgi:hypothetical protein